jgi:hypothetical protein
VRSGPHADATDVAGRWYRQPVLWLGALILIASLAGIAVTIVVASRYTDEPLPVGDERILKTPMARPP